MLGYDLVIDPLVVQSEPHPERFSGDSQAIEVQVLPEFAHHGAHAASGKEIFHIVDARGLQIDQYGSGVRQLVKTIKRYRQACAARNRRQMNDDIGRTAYRQQNAERILERFWRDDLVWRPVAADHLHCADTGGFGGKQAIGVNSTSSSGATATSPL